MFDTSRASTVSIVRLSYGTRIAVIARRSYKIIIKIGTEILRIADTISIAIDKVAYTIAIRIIGVIYRTRISIIAGS